MSSPIAFTSTPRPAARASALDRLTAIYARRHHDHDAPLVGCYLCLHGEPRRTRELAAAA